jgi:hypothetical protein
VTGQTKSELSYRACHEVEQHHSKVHKSGEHRSEQAARAIELRQIVARIPSKTGITVPPPFFRNPLRARQQRLPIGSNMLMSGPFLMKLVAGTGKT